MENDILVVVTKGTVVVVAVAVAVAVVDTSVVGRLGASCDKERCLILLPLPLPPDDDDDNNSDFAALVLAEVLFPIVPTMVPTNMRQTKMVDTMTTSAGTKNSACFRR